MYRHILIPTDGPPFAAAKGAKAGVNLTRALGAKATAVYVAMPYAPAVYGERETQRALAHSRIPVLVIR